MNIEHAPQPVPVEGLSEEYGLKAAKLIGAMVLNLSEATGQPAEQVISEGPYEKNSGDISNRGVSAVVENFIPQSGRPKDPSSEQTRFDAKATEGSSTGADKREVHFRDGKVSGFKLTDQKNVYEKVSGMTAEEAKRVTFDTVNKARVEVRKARVSKAAESEKIAA
ncbi:MAG: hypothetical protein ACI9T8_000128 [Candidatus Saccharimonadales bacterium]|jgi:hypothetical protein